jgi:hypothetical protein
MDKELFYLNMMNKTRILKPPRHTLATFGNTELSYVMLSPLPEDETRCRLREARVTAQRPMIVTPDLWKKRFEGFGEQTEEYKGLMDQLFGDTMRGLEYTFKNTLDRTALETAPLEQVADRALSNFNRDNPPRTALIQGPDGTWALSIMKFIVDMTLRSFPVNYRELQEHDLFDPQKRVENRTRARVESLFKQAIADPNRVQELGEALRESGLFKEYEDRFFALVKSNA